MSNCKIVFANGNNWNDPDDLDCSLPKPGNSKSGVESALKSIKYHLDHTVCEFSKEDDSLAVYQAVASSVRDKIADKWKRTEEVYRQNNAKMVNYLSMEFLVGRSLQNSILNLEAMDEYAVAIRKMGFELENLAEQERDPALGNGGLGRLAACFMDSLTTLNYPAVGYGLRYKHGMFKQQITANQQVELPDSWLSSHPNPWEYRRHRTTFLVRFYGHVKFKHLQADSANRHIGEYSWQGGELVRAVAYDTPVTGFRTDNVNMLRLWSSEPLSDIDLALFNEGCHVASFDSRDRAEAITSVLYPNDNHEQGKEIRLKQQFFFVSATLQDILSRFKATGKPISEFHRSMAVQLNDTHPTMAIPELLRLLLDQEGLNWEQAWDIVVRTFGYTNHTILPEALERWSVPLVEKMLPRHMQIVYEINHRHLQAVSLKWPGDIDRLARLSLIEESSPKSIRMAQLATVGSHSVNGVAEIHSSLVKSRLFPDFVDMMPAKFSNKTNGVTLRRWVMAANPSLSEIITCWLQTDEWLLQPELLERLKLKAMSPVLQAEWRASKRLNKGKLSRFILATCGVKVSPNALFDVHVKRIHEYKRQLLNILSCIYRYHSIKTSSQSERSKFVPRVTIFGGKAAPGYLMAKKVIHLINAVAEKVNSDPDIGDLFKVVFVPNYNVSAAEVIIPASDVSQHISTAGMEASGTSNMKFCLNGGLLLATVDGATIEIAKALGNGLGTEPHGGLFLFGAAEEEVEGIRRQRREREPALDDRLEEVLGMIERGEFGEGSEFEGVVRSVREGDHFLVAYDWPEYLEAQHCVEAMYLKPEEWLQNSIVNAAMVGRFSSDRTIQEYAQDIWNLKPVPVSPNF